MEYQTMISEQVQVELERAINEFDYAGEVSKIAADVIQHEIKSYLSYGEGHDAIRQAVAKSLEKIFQKE